MLPREFIGKQLVCKTCNMEFRITRDMVLIECPYCSSKYSIKDYKDVLKKSIDDDVNKQKDMIQKQLENLRQQTDELYKTDNNVVTIHSKEDKDTNKDNKVTTDSLIQLCKNNMSTILKKEPVDNEKLADILLKYSQILKTLNEIKNKEIH